MIEITSNKIIKLPKSVYDKIAAGEVIERPVSVVKELIENSIDAGASYIVVEIKKGGKDYIRITDNGSGISKDEIELAFQRHATSKILTLKDLDNILTLGFRGEALSSIVSVSDLELITKIANIDLGIQAIFKNSEIMQINEIGCEKGTTIIVKNLFFNLPGRLKFMKDDHIEAQLIIDLVTKLALSNADKKFKLINNGKIIFSTVGNDDIKSNIASLYEKDLAVSLIEYKTENDFAKLNVLFSNPGYSKSNRKHQVFFVNGRYIHNKLIEKSIVLAFEDRIMKGRYPVVFLFLKINPDLIDVNIHPSKLEIKFIDESKVANFIENAIKSGLKSIESIPNIVNNNYFTNYKLNDNEVKTISQVDIIKLLESKRLLEDFNNDSLFINENKSNTKYYEDNLKANDNSGFSNESISNIKVIGSIFNTYILGRDENTFYIIDQHAAHERVLFFKLKNEYISSNKSLQILLIPIIVNTNFSIKEDHQNIIKTLSKFGFEIENFGPKSFIVRSIPIFMGNSEAEIFVNDFIDNFNGDLNGINDSRIEKTITTSCKNAVKAHDSLNLIEQEHLIIDLSNTDNPFSCPHGRPIILKLSISQIEKMFKRI